MATLTPDATSIVAIAAAGVAVVGLIAAVAANLRVGRVRAAYAGMLGDAHPGDVVRVVGEHVEAVERLRGEVRQSRTEVAGLAGDLADAVRHVAVVRYDAFGDMGGRLSFSAAMLDDGGDGLVITAINGRTETRSYAKGVKDGASTVDLSPEEQQAVDYALGGVPQPGKRRAGTAASPSG